MAGRDVRRRRSSSSWSSSSLSSSALAYDTNLPAPSDEIVSDVYHDVRTGVGFHFSTYVTLIRGRASWTTHLRLCVTPTTTFLPITRVDVLNANFRAIVPRMFSPVTKNSAIVREQQRCVAMHSADTMRIISQWEENSNFQNHPTLKNIINNSYIIVMHYARLRNCNFLYVMNAS